MLLQYVRDISWITNDRILCTVGDGLVQLYSIDASGANIALSNKHRIVDMPKARLHFFIFCAAVGGTWKNIHSKWIREISSNPLSPFHIVSGGYDQRLCVSDLARGDNAVINTAAVDDVISSAKWRAGNP